MLGVSRLLCKRPGFVFGDGVQGKGVPFPCPSLSKPARCHPAILSRAGIRSGHRIVKWLSASRQRRIYSSATAAEAEQHLQELEDKWKAYPSVSQVWRRNWPRITPFFHYPPEIRRAI